MLVRRISNSLIQIAALTFNMALIKVLVELLLKALNDTQDCLFQARRVLSFDL